MVAKATLTPPNCATLGINRFLSRGIAAISMLVLLSANLRAQVSGLTLTTSSLYAVYNTNATVTLATVAPAQGYIVLLTCPDSRGNFKSGLVRLKGGQRDTKIVYNIHVRAPLNSMFAAKIHRNP